MSASLSAPAGLFPLPGNFEPDAVPFAARTTLALLLGYGVSFAIQLDSASSAGLCVAIVAQALPGMALSKAAWRTAGTLIGGVAGVGLVAAFGQDRTMLLGGFTLWLGACAFVASALRDFRSYGAVLSGYTVGIIAIGNIDTPGGAFLSALNRVAAILIGVGSVAVVNTLLAPPLAYRHVLQHLDAWKAKVLAFAEDAGRAGPCPAAPNWPKRARRSWRCGRRRATSLWSCRAGAIGGAGRRRPSRACSACCPPRAGWATRRGNRPGRPATSTARNVRPSWPGSAS